MDRRYTFFINGSDYLVYDKAQKKCILTFLEDVDPKSYYWLLGDPILRTYYLVYDMEKMRVALAGLHIDDGP